MITPAQHILYVDDHQDTCDLLAYWLGRNGWQMTAVGSVAEGLRLATSAHFDLYLIDEWLPDGTGEELGNKIREFDAATPIVFYSAEVRGAIKARVLSTCAQAFVPKLGEAEELTQTIATLLEKGGAIEQRDRDAATAIHEAGS